MSGTKRKDAPSGSMNGIKKQKVTRTKPVKPKKVAEQVSHEEHDEFGGFSGNGSEGDDDIQDEDEESSEAVNAKPQKTSSTQSTTNGGPKQFKLETSSAEAHAKQRALAKERKGSKPNADAIHRSKKIWERLRRKSHVPSDERKQLVAELFDIISGRVRDFVFKHDSVRVIQCALKYANQEQRRGIVQELKGDIRALAESRYAKFLIAKMVSTGDEQVRDAIIPEFYGHVRRLINHPEASWIVDDIYRQIATPEQKATMLREWYGAEFSLFHRKPDAKASATTTQADTADLVKILEKNPEKRKPILQYLLQMINSLIQKKMTGFTMLHDAMLQYFLALTPGSAEHVEFLEILKGDIDAETEGGGGDLFRNLAFTKSGSRLVCLALAYGSAKDRRIILRVFRNTIEMMAYDPHAKIILLVGLDVCDDTRMSAKTILHELLGKHIEDETKRLGSLQQMVGSKNSRLPILYPMAGMAKWLISDQDKAMLEEIHAIRNATSKKSPEDRRRELIEYLSEPLLELIAKRADSGIVLSSFGCQFVTETLLCANESEQKDAARIAVAKLAAFGDPTEEEHISRDAAGARMLKTLVLGGQFDPVEKRVKLVEPRLGFGKVLWPFMKEDVVEWACGEGSFVVVGLLESEDLEEGVKEEVKARVRKGRGRVESAAEGGNKGAKIVLEKIE